jgi:hypothetical protein
VTSSGTAGVFNSSFYQSYCPINFLKSLAQWLFRCRNSNLPSVVILTVDLQKKSKKKGLEEHCCGLFHPYCPLPQRPKLSEHRATDTPTALPDGDPPAGSCTAIPGSLPIPSPTALCETPATSGAPRPPAAIPELFGGILSRRNRSGCAGEKSSDLSCYGMLISLVTLGNMLYIVR